MNSRFPMEIDGQCPICNAPAKMVAKGPWLRGTLICRSCENGSVPRERALALVLERHLPQWRTLDIHESSPANRGISLKIRRECPKYVGSHFHSDAPSGTMVGGFRNENIEKQTFADESFDLVITLDVFEHVFNPGEMFREIYRTLRPGGWYICTFPIRKYQVESMKPRARLNPDGSVTHIETPEYHGNPISGDGALVTFDYGYDIHGLIAYWTDFEVEISRFANKRLGILGEYTEVIACRRPELSRSARRFSASINPEVKAKIDELADEAWLEALGKEKLHGMPVTSIPDLPPEQIQKSTTGRHGQATLRVALDFADLVRRAAESHSAGINRQSRIIDFGAGWGRMALFVDRWLDPGKLICVEPLQRLLHFAERNVPSATFICSDTQPPLELPAAYADVVYAYSVFSHFSEDLATAWMKEFARVLRPNGLAILTTRARAHIVQGGLLTGARSSSTDTGKFIQQNLADYDAGRFVFASSDAGTEFDPRQYGEAAISKAFAERWLAEFELVDWVERYSTEYVEPAIVFRRR